MSVLSLVTIVVDEYDRAITFCARLRAGRGLPGADDCQPPGALGGVRPPGGQTGLLLACADGSEQAAVIGRQVAGRVGFFLRVADSGAAHSRMVSAGVQFVTAPRTEAYGRVAIFLDVAGNRWDLVGPEHGLGS